MTNFVKISKCRICDGRDLRQILDLRDQPPANSLTMSPADENPAVPLVLVFCEYCKTPQLDATVDSKALFSNYFWVTGTSATAQTYSGYFCDNALSRLEKQNPFVVEVASNDGTFLKKFAQRNCKVLGVDPAANVAEQARRDGVPTLTEFFNTEVAASIVAQHGAADIVIARNVIPHVEHIHAVIAGMHEVLDENGLGIIEFHYARKILAELQYDSIYHEHLFYFSLHSIMFLLEKHDLFVFDILESPISGGALVIYLKKKKATAVVVDRYLENEHALGINTFASWQSFSERAIAHRDNLKMLIAQEKRGKTLIGYGASARSSTLLNFCQIGTGELDSIIDKNPLKKGYYTPGTKIKIISFADGLEKLISENRSVLLLAWNFTDEIVKDLRNHGYQGRFVIPLPGNPHTL